VDTGLTGSTSRILVKYPGKWLLIIQGGHKPVLSLQPSRLFTAVLVIAALLAAGPTAAAALRTHSLVVDGLVRNYTVYLPATYSDKTPSPVVIMLHGAGGSGSGVIAETAWDEKADQAGFLAVFPDAMRPNPADAASFLTNPPLWNDGSGRGQRFLQGVDDVKFLGLLVADLSKNYRIDQTAVFLTGFSNGASLALRAARELPGRFAAVAPVSGHYWQTASSPAHQLAVPTLFIFGTADPLNPWQGGTVSLPWGAFSQPPPLAGIEAWARQNGCPQGLKPLPGQPGVQTLGCSGHKGVPLRAIIVEDLGHIWPGGVAIFPESYIGKDPGSLNATAVIWAFFASIREPIR
jgi:polyhydroxybutyrate depolymerase